MRGVVLLTMMSCAAGCGRDPGRGAPRDPSAPIAARPSPPPPGPPPPSPRPSIPRIACRWHADHLSPEVMESSASAAKLLRFTVGGAPFAHVFAADAATLEIPVALASAGGELEVDSGGITVRGHLESSEMPLYPARVLMLAGVYIPTSRVTWRAASAPGHVTLAVDDVSHVRGVDGRASFEVEGRCEDVALGARSDLEPPAIERAIGAPGALTKPRAGPPFRFLKAGVTWIATTADASPAAAIEGTLPPDDTLLLGLRVLETRADKVRVILPGYGGVLVGWIERERLGWLPHDPIDLSHDCASMTVRQRTAGPDDVVCARDVPLAAEVGGERHLVGTAHAGARIHLGDVRDGFRAVDFPRAQIGVTDEAAFLVRSEDLSSCRRAPTLAP